MLNIKWGAIAGGIALVLSMAIGIFHGNNMSYVLLRAFIFGAVFFGLGLGIWALVSSFVPELLYADSASDSSADSSMGSSGSRVNITLDGGAGALPEMYRNPDNPEEVGNITDLMAGAINPAAAAPTSGTGGGMAGMNGGGIAGMNGGGMDQNRQDGYTYNEGGGTESYNSEYTGTEAGESPSFQEGQRTAAVFTPSFESTNGFGGLPDLDAMAGAFLANAGVDAGPVPSASSMPEMPAIHEEPELPERKYAGNKPQPLKGDFNPKELAQGIRTVLSKET